MNTRTWYYSKLSAWTPLTALIGNRIRSTGAINDPDHIDRPFLMIRAGSELPQIGSVTRQAFFAYAHVDPASSIPADDILSEVNAALASLAYPLKLTDAVVMECRWLGDSDDLFDDAFRTTVRFTTHDITVSK